MVWTADRTDATTEGTTVRTEGTTVESANERPVAKPDRFRGV
jgi:hypothetical protein